MYCERKNIRLKNYDYSSYGMYFTTICVQDRKCILSDIVQADDSACPRIRLTKMGEIIEKEILLTEAIRKNIKIHDYIIMPDHVHIIIEIISVGVAWHATQRDKKEYWEESKMTLPRVIQQLKAVTVKCAKRLYVEGLNNISGLHTMQPLQWQRNYYEHVIRNEEDLNNIKEYIKTNPINWQKDKLT